MASYHDYAGVIHVHSTYSDGFHKVKEIIRAANSAGCDFVILTDHDTLQAKSQEGWYQNTVLLVGEEITVGKNKGHYLGIGIADKVFPHRTPQETINEVKRQGGIGFIAHPYTEKNGAFINFTSVRWQDWNVTGFDGMEIWNYTSDWKESFNWLNWPRGLIFPEQFIDGPVPNGLKKWDELLLGQKVTGIGSVDAHGYFYSYKKMFKTLRTHVLLGEAFVKSSPIEKARSLIYDALKKGSCYFSNDYVANAHGFKYLAENGKGRAIMGGELPRGRGTKLTVLSPQPGLLRIVMGGRIIAEANSQALVKIVNDPGAYRAEVFLDSGPGRKKALRPWIFSNPIYVY